MRLSHEGTDLAELTARMKKTYGPEMRVVKTERIRDGGVMGFFAKERYRLTIDVPQPAARQGENMAAQSFARSDAETPEPHQRLNSHLSEPRNESMLAALIEAAEHGDGDAGDPIGDADNVATVRHYDSVDDCADGVDPMFAHLLHAATTRHNSTHQGTAQQASSAPRAARDLTQPRSGADVGVRDERGAFGYSGFSRTDVPGAAGDWDERPTGDPVAAAKPARAAGYGVAGHEAGGYGVSGYESGSAAYGGTRHTPAEPRGRYATPGEHGFANGAYTVTGSAPATPGYAAPRPQPTTYSHGERLTAAPAPRQSTRGTTPGHAAQLPAAGTRGGATHMPPRSARRPEYPTAATPARQMPEMFSQYAPESRESGATSAASPAGEYAQIMAAAARPGNTGSRQSPRTEQTRPQQNPTSGHSGVTEFNPFGTAQPGRRPTRAPYQGGEQTPMGYERTTTNHERAQAHYAERGAGSLSGRLRRHVRDRGLPAAMLEMLPEDAHLEDLLGLLKRLPRCDMPVPTPGFVAAVVGASPATTAVATRLGAFLGGGQLPVTDTKVVTSSRQARAGAERIRTSDGVGALAVSLRYENREAADAAATMLAVSAPDVVLLCVDAGRKRSDTLTFVSSLLQQGITIDGLAVINARNTSEPATVLELGIGIWELDGAMADPLSWMPVLLSGFAE